MNWYARSEHRTPAVRLGATWNAAATGSLFAAALSARVGEQDRMLAEAACRRSISRVRRGRVEDGDCGDSLAHWPPWFSDQLAGTISAAWRLVRPRGDAVDAAQLATPAIARMRR